MSLSFFGCLRRWTAASLMVSLLAACATPERIAPDGDTAFQRTGRFSVTVEHVDGTRDAVQGGFAWLDTGTTLTLDLSNPLGSTLARVTVNNGLATLTHSNGAQEYAPDADSLVDKVLGSPVPVAGLRDWLRGRTAAGVTHDTETDSDTGQLAGFVQNGWRVRLSRYDALGPTVLQLNRNDGTRTLRVRLAITPVADAVGSGSADAGQPVRSR